MFVKSIAAVVLLCAVSTAHAQQNLKELYSNAQEYLATVRAESESMTSFTHNEGVQAIQRAQRQFHYMETELKYLKSKLTQETEGDYQRLESTAREAEEIISQNIALAVGVGALQIVTADLEKKGKIENTEVFSLPEGRSVSRGDFKGYSTAQNLYDVGMGLPTTTKKLTLTYTSLLKVKKQKTQITARMGSHVRSLAELKKLMDAGADIFNWVSGEFYIISGISRNLLNRFVLFGNDVSFSSLMKTDKGWISHPPFFSYTYGVVYIGEIQMKSIVSSDP